MIAKKIKILRKDKKDKVYEVEHISFTEPEYVYVNELRAMDIRKLIGIRFSLFIDCEKLLKKAIKHKCKHSFVIEIISIEDYIYGPINCMINEYNCIVNITWSGITMPLRRKIEI